jgi:hypothetical protein
VLVIDGKNNNNNGMSTRKKKNNNGMFTGGVFLSLMAILECIDGETETM